LIQNESKKLFLSGERVGRGNIFNKKGFEAIAANP
jgi:hypothetical protein